jgi:Ca-activated chloride channel family protein
VNWRDHAGGEVFIPRLWATRKIGALLNTIRLHGEDPELVDSIVRLSIRYGIITPYTSFLITEDDIFTQTGVDEAQREFEEETMAFEATSGADAVGAAEAAADLSSANAPAAMPTMTPSSTAMRDMGGGGDADGEPNEWAAGEVGGGYDEYAPGGQTVQYAGDRTFVWRDGAWIDTLYEADTMTPTEVVFLSDEYFDLLDLDPVIGEFLALGDHVLFVWEGEAYEVVPE